MDAGVGTVGDLVAGGDDEDPRQRNDFELPHPAGGGHAEAGGSELGTGPEHGGSDPDVAAAAADEGTGLDSLGIEVDGDLRGTEATRLRRLDGNDRVRARRQRGAGHDLDGGARGDRAPVDPGGDLAGDGNGADAVCGCRAAQRVSGDGEAVHARIVEAGDVDAGDDVGGKPPRHGEQLGQRTVLGPQQRRDRLTDATTMHDGAGHGTMIAKGKNKEDECGRSVSRPRS
ncbi:Uncharacterised protein [Mycobacteroides abscessus subsp. abscessus]|nr:Uncharacterised protein [Mycobacteroides abscessus subsp. abscessus]